ncbi:hypothetical protein LguiA_026431 [Lonicera macranthoides]
MFRQLGCVLAGGLTEVNDSLLSFSFIFKNYEYGDRASIQGSLYSDEEMYVGGGLSMFPMDDAYDHGSGGKSRSSKRSKTSLDVLMETMLETLRAKKSHYYAKATSAEEHTMIECLEKYASFWSSIWPRCREVNIGQGLAQFLPPFKSG